MILCMMEATKQGVVTTFHREFKFNKAKDGNIFEIKYILSKTDIQAQYDTILYQEDGELDKLGDDIKNKICEELWNKRL